MSNKHSPEWTVRPFRRDDIPGIVDIVRARSEAYGSDSLLSADEVLWRMQGPGGSKPRPAIVVTGPDLPGVPHGALLGAGSVNIEGSPEVPKRSYILQYWGHPAAVEYDVERTIIARLIGLIREYDSQPGAVASDDVHVYSSYREGVPGRKAIFEDIGMTYTRTFFRMARDLSEPIDEPFSVPGVTIRHYRRPEDNAGACAAYNNSFADHWDHHDETVEDWNAGVADPSRRPDLSWLAEVDAEPGTFAGFCLCVVHDDTNKEKSLNEGWIELLGTTRDWRGKGLGRSLLLHGLQSFKSAGMDTVLLMVDSESPTGANLLYEKAGFRVRLREYVYLAPLSEVKV